jgi:hypothetical protein
MQEPVTQTHPNALAEQARFVFRGTVEQTGASTMPDIVPAANNACVVNVDEILQSPQSLAQAAGQRVTVLLPEGVTLTASEQAVFFTNPWLYGQTLALQAVAVNAAQPALAALARRQGDPVRTLVERDRQARIATADLVIRGLVTAVRLVEDDQQQRRPSEHDPQWEDAVVRVVAVERGSPPGAEVVVRFPGSHDVAWRSAPKFTPGQAGRFVLRRPPASTEPGAEQTGSPIPYTALDRHDFQPAQELLSIEQIPGADQDLSRAS